jgi:ketosteroid isomerase-like protein
MPPSYFHSGQDSQAFSREVFCIQETLTCFSSAVVKETMTTAEITTLLDAKYDAIEEAFKRKDLKAISNYMSPNFVSFDGRREKTRDELIDGLRHRFEEMDVVSWKRHVTKLTVDGDRVSATADGVFRTRNKGDTEIADQRLVNVDVWEPGDGGWHITSSRPVAVDR